MNTLDAALEYASYGWQVVPGHGIINGKCACGKKECHSPGKHPKTKNGLYDATSDIEKIKQLFKTQGSLNIGIRSGTASGFFVLDVDAKSGGLEELHDLEKKHGKLDTLSAKTGGGGVHYYFRIPPDKEIRNGVSVMQGIDIRGENGLIIAAPSLHASGQRYAFDTDDDNLLEQIKDAPEWLISLITDSSHKSKNFPQYDGLEIPSGKRNDTLYQIGRKLHCCGLASITPAILLEVNRLKCNPQLSESEVHTIAGNVAKYCKVSPEIGRERPVLSRAAFLGPIGEIVEKIGPITEADPAAILIQMLTAVSVLIGRNPHVVVGADHHRANIFCVVVGQTAKARKGMSLGIVDRIMSCLHANYFRNQIHGLSSSEGLVEKLKFLQDEGHISPTGWVIEPEFASVLAQFKRQGNTLSSLLRNAWDSKELSILRKNDPVQIEESFLCMTGHITEAELEASLSNSERYNGFGNRILWVFANRTKSIPLPKEILPKDFQNELDQLANNIKCARSVGKMNFTRKGEQAFKKAYLEFDKDKSSLVDALSSRDQPYLLRLAMIYALSMGCEKIDDIHIEAAKAVVQYSNDTVEYLFGGKQIGVRAKIVEALKSVPQGLTRTELHKHFNNRCKADELNRAIQYLLNHGVIRIDSDSGSANRYRLAK